MLRALIWSSSALVMRRIAEYLRVRFLLGAALQLRMAGNNAGKYIDSSVYEVDIFPDSHCCCDPAFHVLTASHRKLTNYEWLRHVSGPIIVIVTI